MLEQVIEQVANTKPRAILTKQLSMERLRFISCVHYPVEPLEVSRLQWDVLERLEFVIVFYVTKLSSLRLFSPIPLCYAVIGWSDNALVISVFPG